VSDSLTYNSIDLADYGFVVESNGFALASPTPRVNRQPLTNRDGEASQGVSFDARVGTVSGVITAANLSALQTARRNVEAALAAGQTGGKALTFDAVSGKQWTAKVTSIDFGSETATTLEVAIQFYAAQPWPIATSETEGDDESVSPGGTTL